MRWPPQDETDIEAAHSHLDQEAKRGMGSIAFGLVAIGTGGVLPDTSWVWIAIRFGVLATGIALEIKGIRAMWTAHAIGKQMAQMGYPNQTASNDSPRPGH